MWFGLLKNDVIIDVKYCDRPPLIWDFSKDIIGSHNYQVALVDVTIRKILDPLP